MSLSLPNLGCGAQAAQKALNKRNVEFLKQWWMGRQPEPTPYTSDALETQGNDILIVMLTYFTIFLLVRFVFLLLLLLLQSKRVINWLALSGPPNHDRSKMAKCFEENEAQPHQAAMPGCSSQHYQILISLSSHNPKPHTRLCT